jgi:hypothetical protein
MNYRTFEESDLQYLAQLWQKTLRLQDWDIEYSIVRLSGMSDPGHRGEIEYLLNEATVRILNHRDWEHPGYDMEKTLVHELLHLRFKVYDEYVEGHSERLEALEVSIDVTARLLVDMARQTPDFYPKRGRKLAPRK